MDVLGSVTGSLESQVNSAAMTTGVIGTVRVGGNLLGSVTSSGTILELNVGGILGSPSGSVVQAQSTINNVIAGTLRSSIVTTGNIGFVSANSMSPSASIECVDLTSASLGNGIVVAGDLAGTVRINGALTAASRIRAATISGQVVVNGQPSNNGQWLGPVQIGTTNPIALEPRPSYFLTPALIGGGAIGLAPFRIHRTAGTPAYDVTTGNVSGTINNTNTGSAQVFPAVAFYGSVKPQGVQTTLLTLQRLVDATYVAVPAEEVSFSVIDDGAFDRRVRIAPASGTRPAGFRLRPGQYRATPTTALRCDLVAGETAVSSEGEFLFTIIDGCGVADIANTDGEYRPDNAVDNGDFNAFFAAFFRDETDLDRFFADIANTDGDPSADGLIDNGDFTAFFDAFFDGCSSSALAGGSGGESMLAALGAGGQGIDLSALTSAQLTARLEQLRALGRPVTLQDLQTIMPEVFVGGAGDQ